MERRSSSDWDSYSQTRRGVHQRVAPKYKNIREYVVKRVRRSQLEPATTSVLRAQGYDTYYKPTGFLGKAWGDRLIERGDRCVKVGKLQICYHRSSWGYSHDIYFNVLYCPDLPTRDRPRHGVCELVSEGTIDMRRHTAYIDGFFAMVRRKHMGRKLRYARRAGMGGYTFVRLASWLKNEMGVKYVSLSPMDYSAQTFWRHMGFRSTYEGSSGFETMPREIRRLDLGPYWRKL